MKTVLLKTIALIICLPLVLIQFLVLPVFAQPTQVSQPKQLEPEIEEAVKKFSALNSRLGVGLTYRSYLEQVAELKVVLDQIPLKSRSNPAYSNLSLAFEDYRFALDVWQNYLEQGSRHGLLTPYSPSGRLLIEEYKVEAIYIDASKRIYLNDALSKVWNRANINTSKAMEQLPN